MPLVDTKFFMSQVLQNKRIQIWTIISMHLWPKLTINWNVKLIVCLFTQMLAKLNQIHSWGVFKFDS